MEDRNAPERPAARFRTALDLHAAGVQMMRLTLRRLHPGESDAQIQDRFATWLLRRDETPPCHREVSWPRS